MFLDYYTRFQLVSVSGYNGMCEVTLYIEATTACRGILLIYHTLQCYITYIPRHGTFDPYLKCGICYTYTTGSSALPDIYAQAGGLQSAMYHNTHAG